MTNGKRIMIVAHFCDYGNENTNNRFNYIAEEFTKAGYNVELITSSFSHRDKKQRLKVENNHYKVTLINEPSYKKNVSLKRLFYSHRKMAENLAQYLKSAEKPDLVYCAIPSINVAEVAAEYAQKESIPFVIDVQDLWPEAYKLIFKNEYIYKLLTKGLCERVDHVYSTADAIVAVSDTYLNRAVSVNKKSSQNITVYLGTNMKVFDDAIYQNYLTEKNQEVLIAYCGTLGHSYNLSVIFEALQGIDHSLYKFVIMGSGPLEKEYQKIARTLNINTVFTGKLPYYEMAAVLKKCDIAVNPIAHGAAQSIINKHGDYAMAGLPVVSIQDTGEYSRLLDLYNCGINCTTSEEVRNSIIELINNPDKRIAYGKNSRLLAEEKFNREKSYASIVNVVQNMLINE